MALRYAAADVMWIRQLLEEMGCACFVKEPTVMYGDNEQANRLTVDDFVSTGNKYIYTPYHWIKELAKKAMVQLRWVGTKANIADLFTKPVPRQVMLSLLSQLTGYSPWDLG